MSNYKAMHRSVSQLKQHRDCGWQYKLQRIDREWQRPAAWLPQGTGVHAAAEAIEKSGRTLTLEQAQEVFIDAYAAASAELMEETPNLDKWFRSGPYRGPVDIERRFGIGLDQTRGYMEYTRKNPVELPFRRADGSPYVEAEFEIDLGGVKVKGYADQVVWDPELGEWVTRDIKTGRYADKAETEPGASVQLSTYGIAFEEEFGIKVKHGDYWMARTGKPTVRYDLSKYSRERLTDMFGELDQKVKADDFEPRPEVDKCRFCPVAQSCEYRAADHF